MSRILVRTWILACAFVVLVSGQLHAGQKTSARVGVSSLADMAAYDATHAAPEGIEVPDPDGPASLSVPESDLKRANLLAAPRGAMYPALPPGHGMLASPPLQASFVGEIDTLNVIPPDTNGAVGPNHVVSMLNNGVTIFDKSGAVVAPLVTSSAFWSVLGTNVGEPANSPFDPRTAYDQYTQRYVAVILGNGNNGDGSGTSWLMVGISQSDNPTGAWNLFAIPCHMPPHETHWFDFPGLGIDPNNIVITGNYFTVNASPSFVNSAVFVIEKAKLIAAAGPLVAGTDYAFFDNICATGGFGFQPCHTFGQTPGTAINYLLSQGWSDGGGTRRFIRISKITGVGATATLDCMSGNDYVEVDCYNLNRLDAPQPNCSFALNTNNVRFTAAGIVRNGKIFATHTVGSPIGGCPLAGATATKCEVAWYEINPAAVGAFPGGTPNQQGRITDPDTYYYFPSIAVNADETIMLGFAASSPTIHGGGYYAVRRAGDPLGAMHAIGELKAGESPYFKRFGGSRNRWGDYSATCVDPVDDSKFWTVQEYARPQSGQGCPRPDTGRWGTWWGSVRVPSCGSCGGDADENSRVEGGDISAFAACYRDGSAFSAGCGCSDINLDGVVDDIDLGLLVGKLLDIGIGDPSELCP